MYKPSDIWNRLWFYIWPDRRYLFSALGCAVGVSAMSLMVTGLLGAFVHASTGGTDVATGKHNRLLGLISLAIMHTGGLKTQLNVISVAIVVIYAVRGLFYYGQTVYFAEAGQRLGLGLRNDIYRHLQGLSLSFFNRQRTGALMSTINNDVPLLQSSVSGLKDLAPAPVTIIVGIVMIFQISVPLSCAALLAVPAMVYSIGRLSRLVRSTTGRTQDKLADVNTLMEETFSGIRIIQSFGAEKYATDRFRLENGLAKDLAMRVIRQSAKLKPVTDVIGAAGIALALWFAGKLIISHKLTLEELVQFIYVLNQVAVGVSNIGGAKVTWEQIQAGGSRIFENVLDVQSEIKDAPGAVALQDIAGKIEFDHVAFAYNENTPVLRDISFTMNPGEVVAVVGLSGAGKSTIADLIPRFYDPQGGVVRVDGHDVREVTLASLRHQIAIVPQETVLFGGTIRDNIAYGNPSATDAMIQAAARAANADIFISDPNVMPNGYNTIVGERGKQVSGGQRQRIAIARALLKDPRILILDEATSSLDAESEKVVQEALETLMRGRTTLVIAHRLSTIQNAHKILVMEAGRILESGTHNELMRRPDGLYRHLYERFHEKKFSWENPDQNEDEEGLDPNSAALTLPALP
jgi:subfamily B ATP-binding cassette protein MsbA